MCPASSPLRKLLGLLALGVLAGCAAEDSELAIRELIAEAEQAAEARNTRFFRGLISPRYRDSRGYDREQLIALIRGYFLAYPGIEIFSKIESVSFSGEDVADVTIFAGVVGRRQGATLAGGLEGDLNRLELEMVRESGEWRLIGAQWEDSMND